MDAQELACQYKNIVDIDDEDTFLKKKLIMDVYIKRNLLNLLCENRYLNSARWIPFPLQFSDRNPAEVYKDQKISESQVLNSFGYLTNYAEGEYVKRPCRSVDYIKTYDPTKRLRDHFCHGVCCIITPCG